MDIRTGDKVIVIKGKDRGKTGVVSAVDKEKNRIKIEGLNIIKRHIKKNARVRNAGGVVETIGSINAANAMLVDPQTGKATRVGHQVVGEKKIRVTKKSNSTIEDVKK